MARTKWDLIEKRLDCEWLLAPVAERIGALARSSAKYPNIKPDHEFDGYNYTGLVHSMSTGRFKAPCFFSLIGLQ